VLLGICFDPFCWSSVCWTPSVRTQRREDNRQIVGALAIMQTICTF